MSVDVRLGFSLQVFCVLYFTLSVFLTKNVFECIVYPNYLIECCNSTLINLVLKTIVLIFNTAHRWDVLNIGTNWSDINYDMWDRNLLTIHFSHSSL